LFVNSLKKNVTSLSIIPALTSKQIDVIGSSMSITSERQKVIDFTDKYYRTPTVIIGAKDGVKDISPEHLRGKMIGVQVSTIHQKYVKKYYGDGSIIKTYQTQDEADQDLTAAISSVLRGRQKSQPRFFPPAPSQMESSAWSDVGKEI
jgi:ABC-type amino acid transport substrate-binding protein